MVSRIPYRGIERTYSFITLPLVGPQARPVVPLPEGHQLDRLSMPWDISGKYHWKYIHCAMPPYTTTSHQESQIKGHIPPALHPEEVMIMKLFFSTP
jgi:hypothetical protein